MQNPQNPYEQPPRSPVSSPVTSNPSRAGVVSLDVIGEAWTLLKPSIAPWVGAILIVGVIQLVFVGLQTSLTPRNAQGLQQPGAMSFLLQIISTIVSVFLTGALFKMAIQHVKTGRAEIGEMFNIGDIVVPLFVASILVGLITIVGIAACIIPGIIAALGLSMTTPLVVDQKLGATEAISRSWAMMKGNLLSFLVLGLVLGIINLGGMLACGVGLLVTAALSQLALALVYKDLFLGGNINQNQRPMPPSAPIADPFN